MSAKVSGKPTVHFQAPLPYCSSPDHIVAAIKELGPKAFGDDVAVSWRTFLDDVGEALQIDERDGLEAARDAFADTLAGRADPAVGIVVRP